MHQPQHPILRNCLRSHQQQLIQQMCQSFKRNALIHLRKKFLHQMCPYKHQNHHHRATNVEPQSRKKFTKLLSLCVFLSVPLSLLHHNRLPFFESFIIYGIKNSNGSIFFYIQNLSSFLTPNH